MYQPKHLNKSVYTIAPGSVYIFILHTCAFMHFGSRLPLLILCFSPLRIPGVSITLMLSRTGLGSCAHTNLKANPNKQESQLRTLQSFFIPLICFILEVKIFLPFSTVLCFILDLSLCSTSSQLKSPKSPKL